ERRAIGSQSGDAAPWLMSRCPVVPPRMEPHRPTNGHRNKFGMTEHRGAGRARRVFRRTQSPMRYLPLTDADRAAMLDVIGAPSIDALFADVPEEARLAGPIEGLPNHASEMAVERHMTALAAKNLAAGSAPFFLGAGAYRHH